MDDGDQFRPMQFQEDFTIVQGFPTHYSKTSDTRRKGLRKTIPVQYFPQKSGEQMVFHPNSPT